MILALKGDGFLFEQSFCLSDAWQRIQEQEFDLLILDVNLPDGSGLEFLPKVKEKYGIPVILLTANDMETDIVAGLELGADDYITKPFSLMILRARVNIQLRRTTQQRSWVGERGSRVYTDGVYLFDFDNMEFKKDGQAVELSKTEQKLLRKLVENKGITLQRSTLVDTIWTDGAEYVDENALSVTVKRLRDKLEENPSAPAYIKTVYGIGYVWGNKN